MKIKLALFLHWLARRFEPKPLPPVSIPPNATERRGRADADAG